MRRPFQDKTVNFLAALNEGLLVGCSLLMLGFLDKKQDKATTEKIGYAFIAMIAVVLIINWVFIVPAEMFKLIMKIVRDSSYF